MAVEGDWQALIEEWKRNGKSQRDFAAERGIELGKLQYHLYKKGWKKRTKGTVSSVRMVLVRLSERDCSAEPAPPASRLIEVELNTGVLIRFPPVPSRAALQVFEALDPRSRRGIDGWAAV